MENEKLKSLKAELRALRKEMKENGVRKVSPFNGGLSRTEISYNTTRFRLETEIKREEEKT